MTEEARHRMSSTGDADSTSLWSAVSAYLSLCTPEEKRRLLSASALSFVVALIQAVSVVSVMPFLALASDPDLVTRHDLASSLYAWGGFTSQARFVAAAGVASILVIVVANFLTALGMRAVLGFVWDQHSRITVTLFSRYLGLPYLDFRGRHSSDLTQKLLNESGRLSDGVAMQVVTFAAEGLTGVVLFGLLVVVDPMLAVSVAVVLGAAYSVIYSVVKRRQNRLGEERTAADRQRYRFAQDAFGGFKDYVLAGRPPMFVSGFAPASDAFSRSLRQSLLLGLIPRYVMEAVAFGGVIILAMVLYLTTDGASSFIPQLGLYAFAGYKLLPALQHTFQAANRLQYNRQAIRELKADLTVLESLRSDETIPAVVREEIPADWSELRARDVSFAYPGSDEDAIHAVTLTIPRFSSLGLVGTTGSGKSTFADILLGLITPSVGSVALDEWDLTHPRERAWRDFCCQVPQEIFLLDDTIAANVAFGTDRDEIDEDRVRATLDAAQVLRFVEQLPEGIHTTVGERGARLSGGERQRVGIARALYRRPQLLVLDEATSSLDTVTEAAVMRSVAALSRDLTVVHIAHRIATVRHLDRIAVFDKGRVVAQGSYDDLVESSGEFLELVKGQVLS